MGPSRGGPQAARGGRRRLRAGQSGGVRVEDWVVEWHRKHETQVWIMDPFARAATGVDENSNTEVGVWLDTFDVIKERAGISEGIIPTHTGRAEQDAGQ